MTLDLTAPDFAHAALITIDVQRDFLDGQPFAIHGTSDAVPQIAMLAQRFRTHDRPIVHVVRLYRDDGSNAEPCRRHIMAGGASLVAPNSPGSQLAEAILPDAAAPLDADLLLAGCVQWVGAHESILYKPRWGAFYDTSLEVHLRAMRVNTLVFAGCNFPNCPRTSIYEASERDFRIVLVEDAVSGLYPQGRAELEAIGVRIMTADEVERAV